MNAMNEAAAPALGYSRESDVVTLRLTRDDFEALLIFMGMAGPHPDLLPLKLRLINAVNAGRPLTEWRPYAAAEQDAHE